jgi:hypothetical protein
LDWIPVKERLPELTRKGNDCKLSELVLATGNISYYPFGNGEQKIIVAWYVVGNSDSKDIDMAGKKFWATPLTWDDRIDFEEIVAWMPLPEPYK